MTAQVFHLSDIQILDSEPRILDIKLAEALGFDRLRKIRELISRNLSELREHGEVSATVAETRPTVGRPRPEQGYDSDGEVFTAAGKTSPRGARPSVEYYLNEAQALLVAMFSRTEKAAEVRRQLIEVFMAWRRGQLAPALPGLVPPGVEPLGDEPTQRLNAKVGLIREARVLFGPERAKKLWGALGLPDVPVLPAPKTDDEEARACLAYFLGIELETGRSLRATLLAAQGERGLCKSLEEKGILLRFHPRGFLLANTSDYVESCFRYTDYDGQWRGLLRLLPDVRPDIGRFAGQGSRATFIPWRYVEGMAAIAA